MIKKPEAACPTRLGIVGPGLMGLGIAQITAAAGIPVFLVGHNNASTEAAKQRLITQLEQHVKRGRLTESQLVERMAVIEFSSDIASLSNCTMAIESVPEDRKLKQQVLKQIESTLPEGALIASNTSGLPITGMALALEKRDRFIGLHFFSPVERMRLVELVCGQATSQETVQEALNFVKRLGQHPIVVQDGPGFFTSRVFAAYLDEALAMVNEGISPALVEKAAHGNGRPVGPLAVLDEVSLKLNLQQARQARIDGLPERFCRPLALPVLERMVSLGRSGRHQGGGFYEYPRTGDRHLWLGLATTFALQNQQPPEGVVQQRLRCAEALEALRCLEEGVLTSADDADKASLLGLGFSAQKGGVLHDVEQTGLMNFVAECTGLAHVHGARFTPSRWLHQIADSPDGLGAWRLSFKSYLPDGVT